MKTYNLFFLLIVVGFLSLTSERSFAQWEKVGFPGRSIFAIYQLGHTIIGEYGNSFYRSTDYGKTWEFFDEGLPVTAVFHKEGSYFQGARIFCRNNTVFVKSYQYYNSHHSSGTFAGSIFYCRENDKKWSEKKCSLINGSFPNMENIYMITDDLILAYLDDENGIADENDGTFISSDGGMTWQRRMDGTPTNFHITRWSYAGQRVQLLGELLDTVAHTSIDHSLISDDFGKTWQQGELLNDSGYTGLLYSDSSVWITIHENTVPYSLHWSTNKGVTWNVSSVPWTRETKIENLDFIRKTENLLVLYGTKRDSSKFPQSVMFLSKDLGKSWETFNPPQYAYHPGLIFGGINYYFYQSYYDYPHATDSTFNTFMQFKFQNGLYDSDSKILYSSGENIFAVTELIFSDYQDSVIDSILVSNNSGSNWYKKEFSPEYRVKAMQSWIKMGEKLYTSGMSRYTKEYDMLSSTDDGKNWLKECSLNPFKKIDITQGTMEPMYVHGDTMIIRDDTHNSNLGLFLSLDHGVSWDTLFYPITEQPNLFPYGHFSIDNSGKITLMRGGYSIPPFLIPLVLAESSDLGATWQLKISDTILAPEEKSYWDWYPNDNVQQFGTRYFMVGDRYFPDSVALTVEYFSSISQRIETTHGINTRKYPSKIKEEGGRMYIISFVLYGKESIDDGQSIVYTSSDSGQTWVQLGGPISDATEIAFGSKYIYAVGLGELWRYPKSQLDVLQRPTASARIVMESCYPNPATDEMNITYSVPSRGEVTLKAYDITGIERGKLIDRVDAGGLHTVTWDTKSLLSGTYILRLNAVGESVSKVVQVVR